MIVENKAFYVVQTPEDDYIVSTEAEAIEQLQNGSDIEPETDDVSVAEVSFSGDDWTIKELPWQRIALKLLQG
jgi:hypothetical protein